MKHLADSFLRDLYIKPAIDMGLVEMTDPDSPNSPHQKYKRTEMGNKIVFK